MVEHTLSGIVLCKGPLYYAYAPFPYVRPLHEVQWLAAGCNRDATSIQTPMRRQMMLASCSLTGHFLGQLVFWTRKTPSDPLFDTSLTTQKVHEILRITFQCCFGPPAIALYNDYTYRARSTVCFRDLLFGEKAFPCQSRPLLLAAVCFTVLSVPFHRKRSLVQCPGRGPCRADRPTRGGTVR